MANIKLTASQKEQYDQEGYLIIKNSFNAEEIALLYSLATGDVVLRNNAVDLNDQTGKRTKLTLWFTPGDDTYGLLTRSKRTIDTVQTLLGQGEVCHFHSKLMKKLFFCFFLTSYCTIANAQDVFKKDYTKPEATEIWDPKPEIVTPGLDNSPPSDAIVLFNGENLGNWLMSKDGSSCQWNLNQGIMTAKPGSGDIQTKQKFGDCQLHIEFMLPANVKNSSNPNNAGNSGVFIQERYEVQIFDSYQNETPLYANGQCGSIYKQVIPMANASSRPGEWNTYDIYYTAPIFRYNGSLEKPAFITVVHNGVLILNHFEIQGTIKYIGSPRYELHDKASIKLQEHGSEVSFRNIWIREL